MPKALLASKNNQKSSKRECESFCLLLKNLRGGSSYDERYSSPTSYPYQGSYIDNRARRSGDDRYYGRNDDDYYYSQNRDGARRDTYGRGDDGDDYYNDRGTSPSQRREPQGDGSSLLSSASSIIKYGNRQVGLSLLAVGVAVTFLGVTLFFNRSLMRLGNLLVVAGVPVTLGPSRTSAYFFGLEPRKMRATACLALGIFLTFLGNPVLGMILEVFGLLNLFGNMFPFLLMIAKQMPVIGTILNRDNNSNDKGRRGRYGDDYDDRRDADDYDYGRDGQRGRDNEKYY